MIHMAKFCAISLFFMVSPTHTVKQWNNLLNIKAVMIVSRVDLSNKCFTQFDTGYLYIWILLQSVTCSSKCRCESITTPSTFVLSGLIKRVCAQLVIPNLNANRSIHLTVRLSLQRNKNWLLYLENQGYIAFVLAISSSGDH